MVGGCKPDAAQRFWRYREDYLAQGCGCLGGSGHIVGSNSFVWIWGSELLFGVPAEQAPPKLLFDAIILFFVLLQPGQGGKLLLQHLLCTPSTVPALPQRLPGNGMLGQPGARRTSMLALNCSKCTAETP